MNFVSHPSNNTLLTAPANMEDCADLPATRFEEGGSTVTCSFWTPSPEELAALNRGCQVMLYVYGQFHPPIAVSVAADHLGSVR